MKTDSGKHFFGAVAVLGARSARKTVNRCHFNRFPRGFLVHVRPAQHHNARVTQEDGTGKRPAAPARAATVLTAGSPGPGTVSIGIFEMR